MLAGLAPEITHSADLEWGAYVALLDRISHLVCDDVGALRRLGGELVRAPRTISRSASPAASSRMFEGCLIETPSMLGLPDTRIVRSAVTPRSVDVEIESSSARCGSTASTDSARAA